LIDVWIVSLVKSNSRVINYNVQMIIRLAQQLYLFFVNTLY